MKICLHRGRGFISRIIRWQTRGPYSHASILLDDGRVLESREFKGVRILDKLSPARGESIDIFEITAPLPNEAAAIQWALKQVGKKYDYHSIIRFVTRQQQDRTDSGKWFCSEYVFATIAKAGLRLLSRIEPWAVDPNRLSTSPYEKHVRSLFG